METILEQVENYWDKRSEGYSEVNVAELNSYKMNVWKELINTGYKKVMVEQEIGELVWDKEEQVNYAPTPMFMIFAEI